MLATHVSGIYGRITWRVKYEKKDINMHADTDFTSYRDAQTHTTPFVFFARMHFVARFIETVGWIKLTKQAFPGLTEDHANVGLMFRPNVQFSSQRPRFVGLQNVHLEFHKLKTHISYESRAKHLWFKLCGDLSVRRKTAAHLRELQVYDSTFVWTSFVFLIFSSEISRNKSWTSPSLAIVPFPLLRSASFRTVWCALVRARRIFRALRDLHRRHWSECPKFWRHEGSAPAFRHNCF